MTAMPPATTAGVLRWIRFTLQGQDYGVDIRTVREVLSQAEIEPVPGAPGEVMGVINLRGQIVTVIDFARWLGREPVAAGHQILVMDHHGIVLGLAVNAVYDVTRVEATEIKPVPRTGSGERPGVLNGLVVRDDGLLTLMDADALLAQIAA